MSILQTINLKKYYGTKPNITRALDGVNFTVEQGEFVAVVGTHRDAKTNSGDDYYWMDISAFGLFDGQAYSSQEGVIAESNSRNDNYGTFVSLCLPDIDNDAVKLRFNSKSVMYSDPEVYAVLQASPYFSDVQESYEYINNGDRKSTRLNSSHRL